MMSLFFGLLLISAPIFWIIGVITVIKTIFGHNSSGVSRIDILKEILPELKSALKNRKTLESLVTKYENEATGLNLPQGATVSSEIEKPAPKDPILSMKPVSKETSVLSNDLGQWWERWYQENTINLLLYIGAFLIVMSASIFVGLSWQSLSGSVKSVFLDLLTLVFLFSGLYFYFVTPKLKNAGATFIAIAALLIPFNGLAWYNFVLKDFGESFSTVRLVTSIISVVTYAFLAKSIHNKFYTYIAGVGGLSFVEAFVSVGNLPTDYYILGGIFSAFVFIGTAKLFEGGEEAKELFYEPLYFSSQIVMPSALLLGLVLAASQNKLFTNTTSIAALLASSFYYFSYFLSKELNFLATAQILTSVTVGIATKAFGFSNQAAGYTALATSYLHFATGLWQKSSQKLNEAEQSLFISLYTATFAVALLVFFHLAGFGHLAALTIGLSLLYLLVSLVLNKPLFLTGFWALFGLGAFFWFQTTNREQFLFSYLLLAGAAVFFATAVNFWKTKKDYSTVLLAGVGTYLAFAYLFALGNTVSLMATNFTISSLALVGAFVFEEPNLIYAFWIFFGIGSFVGYNNYLNLGDKLQYFALILSALATLFYFLATWFWKKKKDFALSLLAGSVFYLGFAHAFAFSQPNVFLVVNLVTASLALAATYFFEETSLSYVANFFMYLGLWTFLRIVNLQFSNYPFAFAAGSLAFYLASFLPMEEHYRQHARKTSLAASVAAPLFFGYSALSALEPSTHGLERNALITAWVTTALYGFEAYRTGSGFLGYFASAYFMLSLLWQEKFAGIHNLQAYTIPIAIYFLVLSYLQRLSKKLDRRDLFDGIGLFILFVPIFFQSFGEGGGIYALLMGVEGGIILALGTSLSSRNYIYIGGGAIVLAVLVRTISFISSLPAWITVGGGGLLFLSVAIYLLATRKNNQ